MNLRDLKRVTQTTFGACEAGCGECSACRALALVEMAWKAGRRSGAASAVERDGEKMPWDEWTWDQAAHNELLRFGAKLEMDAAEIAGHFERARLWAASNRARRHDWMAFVKLWMSNERKRNPLPERQGSLFGSGSATSRDSRRHEIGMSLVRGTSA